MTTDTMIGVDLAKHVFQVHGASRTGEVLFRKKLSRSQFQRFMAQQRPCVVAMETCGGAHYWAREMHRLGHSVKLIAPRYVKPFVKRHKNDAADAEAIVEAAQRPEMCSVEVKSEEQQARAILFRTREQFVRQRTDLVNALRAHLYEFGYAVPQGIGNLGRLEEILLAPETGIPGLVRELGQVLLGQIGQKNEAIHHLDQRIRATAGESEDARRLQTIPGVGPITALAIEAFAPDLSTFRRGRDFAAWLGLVPRQHSSGGKQRLGRVSKAGQRDIRRLLIIGAMSRLNWLGRKSISEGSWLDRLKGRKPRMLVAVALANKMARMIWAIATRKEVYRDPELTLPAC
jgi:transposase